MAKKNPTLQEEEVAPQEEVIQNEEITGDALEEQLDEQFSNDEDPTEEVPTEEVAEQPAATYTSSVDPVIAPTAAPEPYHSLDNARPSSSAG